MSENEEKKRILILKHVAEFHVRIHNDITNASRYYRQHTETRIKADDRDGLAFDFMSCLLLTAFGLEAVVNFYGMHKFADKWDERQSTNDKIKQLADAYGLKADFSQRPYQSITELWEFRDMVAHGKPATIRTEEILEVTEDNAERPWPTIKWEQFLKAEVVHRIYDDIEKVEKEIIEKSGVELYDTISGGSGSMEFLGEKWVKVKQKPLK